MKNMKYAALVLAALMALSVCGCAAKTETTTAEATAEPVAETTEETVEEPAEWLSVEDDHFTVRLACDEAAGEEWTVEINDTALVEEVTSEVVDGRFIESFRGISSGETYVSFYLGIADSTEEGAPLEEVDLMVTVAEDNTVSVETVYNSLEGIGVEEQGDAVDWLSVEDDHFTVRLACDEAAGEEWTVEINDTALVEEVTSEVVDGRFVESFRGISSGETYVSFYLGIADSTEEGAPLEEVDLMITVAEDNTVSVEVVYNSLEEIEEDIDLTGGFTLYEAENAAILPEDAQAAFDKALEGFVGNELKPLALLGTQVVAGTNYSILCQSTLVTAEPVVSFQVVTIYADLEGNAEILNIADFNMNDYTYVEGTPELDQLEGGWTVYTDEIAACEMPEDAQTSFEKAAGSLVGVSYEPIAYLGSQVVAGTNHVYMCRATTATEEPDTYLAVVMVYADLSDGAEFTSICAVDLASFNE